MMQRQTSFSSTISDVSASSSSKALSRQVSTQTIGTNRPVASTSTKKNSTSLPAVNGTRNNHSLAVLLGKAADEDPILRSLSIPCGKRSDQDLAPIVDFIRGLRFFQVFTRYPETFKQVAQKLELQTYVNGGHVFFEGQPGNEFYIVLDGEISIVKKKRISAYMDFITENVTLVKLSCGQTFGETALDSVDGLRTASAVATKRSSLLMLRREDYHEILFYFKTWLQSAVSSSLRSGTSIFRHLPDQVIETIASRTVVRSFSINAEIFAENTRISSLMIVKSGIVRLMKGMSVETMEQALVESKGKFNRLGQAVNSRPNSSSAMPRIKPKTQSTVSTTFSSTEGSLSEQRAITRDTPPGFWLLKESQEYLDSTKPLRVVTKNAQGADTVTEIHREQNIISLTEKKEQFTVAVLMPGEVLGEISILSPEQLSSVSAFAATAVELYCIDNEILFQFNIQQDSAVMNALLDDWKFRNPPAEEVKKAFQVKYEWQINKKYVLKTLKASRRSTK